MDNKFTHKKIPIIDYGARLTDNRSTCVIMEELSKEYNVNMNNPRKFREHMNKDGKQMAVNNFMKVIYEQKNNR